MVGIMDDISDKASDSIVNKNEQIYRGPYNTDRQKNGDGYLKFETNKYLQKYCGTLVRDNLHGAGIYSQTKHSANYMHEGTIYVNQYEGYSKIIYGNCIYFEGLFKNNKRFGPGILTYPEGFQDVGFWNGMDLMRLADEVCAENVPQLAQTINGKLKMLKYRKLVSIISDTPQEKVFYNKNIRNSDSYFFDRKFYDSSFYNDQDNYIEVATIEDATEESLIESKEMPHAINALINTMIKNMKFLDECTPKELLLLQLKRKILSALTYETKQTSVSQVRLTKKVFVTDLLAWNNEDFCMNILKHAFKHRQDENIVNYNVSKLLKGDRSTFGTVGIQEAACRAFLTSCSEGRLNDAFKIYKDFAMNPDVTDSNGNSGVIYAASRDHIKVIKALTNLGAKLDIVNDEGLTSLNICLLRYLSIFRCITNWEGAFLSNQLDGRSSNDNNNPRLWNEKELMVSSIKHSYFSNISYCDGEFFHQHQDLILDNLNSIVNETESLNWFLEKMKISETEMQHFQSFYVYTDDPKQTYIFNWDIVPSHMKKKKPKVTNKLNNNKLAKDQAMLGEIEKKLDVITNSIQILLHLGANPNIGDVPMPAVILALYCDNVKILRMILNGNVDINNQFSEHKLGLLHILSSMPATANMSNLAEVLLKKGIDATSRTHSDHWKGERNNIIGETFPQPDDCGKTPLHILATRLDFDLDPEGYLNKVAQIIVLSSMETLKDTYLGHTPLSLAALRGNINLVSALLDVGADPNDCLSYGLGNSLTVFCLKRYKRPKIVPTVAACESILDILIQRWANPLLPIEEFGNALEFIEADNYIPPAADSKIKSKDKKNKKDKGKKKGKKSAQDEIKEYLLDLTKSVIIRNIQGKLFVIFLNKLFHGTIYNYKNLAQFFTIEDILRIIRIFHQRKILDLSHEVHYFSCVMLLEFIKLYGNKIISKEKKEKKKKTEKKNKNADQPTEASSGTVHDLIRGILHSDVNIKYPILKNFIEFELDNEQEKYQACSNCGLRTGKVLIACPLCGLVYYCSQKCNTGDKNAKSRHPCRTIFYDDELRKKSNQDYKNNLEIQFKEVSFKVSTPSEIINSNPTFAALITAMRNPDLQISSVQPMDMLQAMGLNAENLLLDTKINKEFDANSLKNIDKVKFSESVTTSLKYIAKTSQTNNSSQSTPKDILGDEIDKVVTTGITFSADNINTVHFLDHVNLSRKSNISVISNEHKVLSSSTEKGTVGTESYMTLVRNKRFNFNELMSDSALNTQFRAKSSDIKKKKNDFRLNNMETIVNKVRDSVKIFKPKESGVHYRPPSRYGRRPSKVNTGDGHRLSTKKTLVNRQFSGMNQEFINTLNKLFPEIDFKTALAPFVCYSDSQFYYRFSEQKPEYFTTHM